jgi:peptide/nickel transport system substrate-binding protein
MVCSSVLASIVFRSSSATAATKTTLRVVSDGDLKILDPIWTTAYITRNHGYKVWDTLFALDAQGVPRPQMVDRYSISDDGLSYRFSLRPQLLWHDSSPVRAADCVASIRRWGARDGMGRALLDETATLSPLDDADFQLVLRRKVGFVLDALAKIDSPVPFMMPERLANTDPFKQIHEAVGSGPFRFIASEWVAGVKAVYERFTGYVPRPDPPSQAAGGKIAKVDRIEMVYLPEPNVAANALIQGEVDILEAPAPDLQAMLRQSPNVVVGPNNPLGGGLFLVINHRQPPFNSKQARQALLWAVRQPDFMRAAFGEQQYWRECFAAYGRGTPNESTAGTEPFVAHDPGKAKALFAGAGYDGRQIVVLDPVDTAVVHQASLVTADMLRGIGAQVDVQAMDWSTLTQRRTSRKSPEDGGWNLFVTGATISSIANPLTNNFARNCADDVAGACDARIPELIQVWARETDATARHAVVEQLQRLIFEDVTFIPLGQSQSVIAYRKSLTGLIPAPAMFYWNISKSAD